jgi:sugar lactone lactonase YvrE
MDAGRGLVWRINPDGTLTALAGKHGNNLVPDGKGNLYVENANESLWRIEPDGSVREVRIPGKPRAVGALDELLAVDAAGDYYFASGNEFIRRDAQLLKMTPAGKVTLLAGSTPGQADGKGSAARFTHLAAAAWGPEGALYVTDAGAVRKVQLDGTVTTLTSRLGAKKLRSPPLGWLLGVAVDAQGNVYAADSGRAAVHRITPTSAVSTLLRSEPPWVPAGVAVAGEAVYVLERRFLAPYNLLQNWLDTVRVQKVAGRRVTTLVTVRPWPGVRGATAAMALGMGAVSLLLYRLGRRRRSPR